MEQFPGYKIKWQKSQTNIFIILLILKMSLLKIVLKLHGIYKHYIYLKDISIIKFKAK